MAVRKKIKIDRILDGTDLKALEDYVLEQERLARRAETAQAKMKRQKKGGIFASRSNSDDALPSAFLRKQRKQSSLGLAGGRQESSAYAKSQPLSEKIRPVDAEYGAVEQLMARLGVKKYHRKESKDSLVSAVGRPVRNFVFMLIRNWDFAVVDA